ncbi:InlB B-repeat-containing protein [Collinsella aerofaciens]|uniref:InlB B-repeat-containing protein n=1 Tax=Collinsella aerofaciens TaxID=74426 RepID=UPI00319E3EF7
MIKRSQAALAVTAGLATSLCFLAPQAFADDALVAAPAPITETSSETAAGESQPRNTPRGGQLVAPTPSADSASEGAEKTAPVVECNGVQYQTFDEALAVAKNTNGATIKLLADAETVGLDLKNDLTIDGNGFTLNFTDKGIALWGKALTFKNVNVAMTGIGSTPYTAEWNWMSVSASRDASLTLDGATLTMDGTGAGNVHAIYFGSNNKLNLKNGSNLTIKNYKQDALEWNGGDGGYNVNIEGGSTYTSDHCRSGFTGTFIVTVDNSKVNVVNSTGNGSNGSHFNIKNDSVVDFSGNGSHGLSAGNLSIDNSTVTANNNALTGIIFTGKGEFKSANVQISGTKGTSYWNAGMRLMKANARLDVDAASTVAITGNKVTGLFLDSGAQATFAEGSGLTITGNDASQENCSTKKDTAQCGGGVVVRNGASLTLPASAVIDNNNAALAGDDLYVEKGGAISFGATHNNVLSDFEGCGHAIDGWYVDAKDSRWSAHGEAKHVEAAQPGTYEAKKAAVAFKAAHGLVSVDYQYVGEAPEKAKLPDADRGLEVGSAYAAKEQKAVDGWTFDGWYTDEGCTVLWNDGDSLTGSMTLYGKWTKKPVQPSDKPKTEITKKTKSTKSLPSTGDKSSVVMTAALAGVGTAVLGFGEAIRRRANSNR